jgi:tripartite-type tricarboxylate transporter receptor subunit TctC
VNAACRWFLATILLGTCAVPAAAQKFPTKRITLVVPYAPGGNVDVSARILQSAIGDSLGQPVIVENRPGAAGLIAGDYVARSDPDGHTLFVGSNGPLILGPLTLPNPAYQWQPAFAPVSSLAVGANVLLVRSSLPVNSVQEMIDYAKRYPDKFTVATDTSASINHFLSELLKFKAGVTWVEVHYRGNAPAITDLIAGHVDAGFAQLAESIQHVRSGKLRVLAVLGRTRVAALPDVPTIAEAGFSDVEGVVFNGVLAPKRTPDDVVNMLAATVRRALESKAVIDQFAALGAETRPSTPEEFTRFLEQETKKWTQVIRDTNIKVSD